jgi:chromatin segregation and condensation protein Rec8/ScpA/Scc1 (kleisin family)
LQYFYNWIQSYTPNNQTKIHSNFLFQDKQNNDNLQVESPVTFSDVYAALPSRLPSKLAENLSAPLAIVALLHLANEKTLDIVGNENLSDLIITQA